VAGGFHQAYKSLADQVIPGVDYLFKKHHSKIHIIGDSLGGAICSFAALDIKAKLNNPIISYYSMEQPRVGNLAFAKFF